MTLPTDSKMSTVVQQIVRLVPELKGYYLESSADVRQEILRNLKESYVRECELKGRLIPLDHFIQMIEDSIGWEWVMPDSEMDVSDLDLSPSFP